MSDYLTCARATRIFFGWWCCRSACLLPEVCVFLPQQERGSAVALCCAVGLGLGISGTCGLRVRWMCRDARDAMRCGEVVGIPARGSGEQTWDGWAERNLGSTHGDGRDQVETRKKEREKDGKGRCVCGCKLLEGGQEVEGGTSAPGLSSNRSLQHHSAPR